MLKKIKKRSAAILEKLYLFMHIPGHRGFFFVPNVVGNVYQHHSCQSEYLKTSAWWEQQAVQVENQFDL